MKNMIQQYDISLNITGHWQRQSLTVYLKKKKKKKPAGANNLELDSGI